MPIPAPLRPVVRTPGTEAVTAFVLGFALLFSGTSRLPIVNGDEARFAQASREMLASGDPIVPTFGGRDRYDKPPVIYWLTAGCFALLGPSPRTARLPSNVAAAASAALLAWWVRRRAGPGSGLLAGILLTVTPVVLVQGRACTADAVTLALTLVAMMALEPFVRGAGRLRYALVLWSAAALAVLTKGPVAPVVIGATGLALWALDARRRPWQLLAAAGLVVVGSTLASPLVLAPIAAAAAIAAVSDPTTRRRLRGLRWGLGAGIASAVLLPWTVAAWKATDGELFRVAIGRHVIERGLTPLEGHAGFPGMYVATAIVLCVPWFGALLAAVPDAWRRRHDDPLARFLLAWLVGPVAVLEVVATKLVHYPMAVYPAAIALVVRWAWRDDARDAGRVAVAAHAIGGALLAIVPVAVAVVSGLDRLLPAATAAAGCLLVGIVVSTGQLRRAPRRGLTVAAVATAVFAAVLTNGLLPALGDELLGPRLIARAEAVREAGDALFVLGLRDEEALFHGPPDLVVCRSTDEVVKWVAVHPESVGVTRSDRLRELVAAHPRWRPVILDRVDGFDLGRGRAAEGVVFRLERRR